ncbi:MAG: tubulin-like doman-containing protein [Sedimentitalea sp.]|uniref:tubulin-like doman-containing protein n=1 Tax=Sedimentitalea sp. TaxID=2048915 RepID=UPI0032671614
MTAEKTEAPEAHNIHVIGIGRTGGAYVEALLRTGEVEDNLALEGSALSGLLIDIGEDDVNIPNDYARSLKSRLAQRGIPAERFHYESFNLALPGLEEFSGKLKDARGPYEATGGSNLMSELPADFTLPDTQNHVPRAVAKAAGVFGLYLDEAPLAAAVDRFADQVRASQNPSTIFLAYSLAGGTGSGISADIARRVKALDLGDKVKIVVVAQLSHSDDGVYENSLAQTVSLEELDGFASGSAEDNPFPGGCFIVSTEHSWQRLTAYTATGIRAVRQHFKQLVTNRFVSDSFMRWAVQDNATHLESALGKQTGSACLMFNVAKFSHPGVQVLPGEPRSRWDSVLQQWVSFVPQYSGLVDGYTAESIDAHIYCARNMDTDGIVGDLETLLSSNYLGDQPDRCSAHHNEFFDELTAYANLIFSNLKKEDLAVYAAGKESMKALKPADIRMEQA